MSYVITDTGKFLTIRLKTSFEAAKYLNFKRNGSAVSQRVSYPEWSSDAPYQTWQIPLYSWRVGDVLSDFIVSTDPNGADFNLWDLNEGIAWFIDGDEVANEHSATLSQQKFDNVGEHTIQAVWKGNKKYATSKTPKTTFYVKQTTDDTSSVANIYHIEYTDLTTDTFKYGDGSTITVKLSKGGVVQGGETVLLSSTRGYTYEATTNPDGVAELKLNDSEHCLEVGTHTLIVTYTEDDTIQCSCQRKVKIEKNDPIITYLRQNNSGQTEGWHKSDEVLIRWQEPNGKAMNDAFFPVYINGKQYTVQTNRNGWVWIRLTETGTFRFKAVYQGNSNINAYQKDNTIVVS